MEDDGKARVLIVDDTLSNFLSVQAVMERFGVACSYSQSGHGAIKIVRERNRRGAKVFDLILMDFQMPGLSGPDTTVQIRRLLGQEVVRLPFLHKERPLICGMTALSHQEVFSLATEKGMDELMLKPLYESSFKRVLSKVGIPTALP